ncbi:PhoX family phosphatase [Pseudomonas sp. OIL-1]|uniref:PhoX family protein n=1 Tax=Pseudomonas sp. OIL-1 TaxID=2706126 RepID=UPI002115AC29|nr:alkaline phosphatase PhoX [Pseudomonas sp. OIL-1]
MMTTDTTDTSRRNLLKGGMALAAAVPFVTTLQAFATRQAHAANPLPRMAGPYGRLKAVKDMTTGLELLQLPDGFNYKTFSWTGDLMIDGQPVPGSHDGMGVVGVNKGRGGREIVLIRNHEVGSSSRGIPAPAIYDTVALDNGQQPGGGNTTIRFPVGIGKEVTTEPSLGGTLVNCAGGVTPWGTWLSCEETTSDLTASGGRKHGYVFEVRQKADETTGQPIVQMGRFKHEAVCVDPDTSIVYQTEDQRNVAGYYRFIPDNTSKRAGALEEGGRLQAAKVKDVDGAMLLAPKLGDEYQLEWVDIADPDAAPQGSASGPYSQARAAGGLTMSRGEGIWYHQGKAYIVDTSAGRDGQGREGQGEGCVWMHDLKTDRISCIFASNDSVIANNPDNITVSPRGGVLLCEDGGGVLDDYGFGERLIGLTRRGESYIFAKNNIVFNDVEAASAGKNVPGSDYRNREFAGACFDPSGHFLFVNVQTPGITFAIWGPWKRGSL